MCASPALGLCGASWLCSVRAQLGVGLGCVRSGQARLNCVRVASVSLRLGPAWFALHGLRRSRPGALFAWPAVVLCSDSPGRAVLTSRRLGLGLGLAWLGMAWVCVRSASTWPSLRWMRSCARLAASCPGWTGFAYRLIRTRDRTCLAWTCFAPVLLWPMDVLASALDEAGPLLELTRSSLLWFGLALASLDLADLGWTLVWAGAQRAWIGFGMESSNNF